MNRRLFGILLIMCLFFGTCIYKPILVCADTPDTSMSDSDMVEAFKAYAKSRDVTIDGSLTDAITNFTTQTYNNLVREIGIDPTALQAELHKIYDSSGVFSRFAFTALGINGFNALFARFLLDNRLAVGDKDVNKSVPTGDYYRIANDLGCFIFELNMNSPSVADHYSYQLRHQNQNIITNWGSFFYDNNYLLNDVSLGSYKNYSFNINGSVYSGDIVGPNRLSNGLGITHGMQNNTEYLSYYDIYYACYDSSLTDIYGGMTVFKFSNDIYSIGTISINQGFNSFNSSEFCMSCINIGGNTNNVVDPDITIVSPDIKPELPDDDPLYIEPDGDVSDDPNGNPVNPDPDPDHPGGTPPNWNLPNGNLTPDGDGGFNLDWDFTLPDLNIDWSIDGLINKFPFSIPHDVYLLCSTLNAEPVTPVIQGTIDLKVHQWVIDWDLHQFDNLAVLLRSLEVLLFLIGLIMITRNIIKG